jgi:hypothetical protein
MVNVNRKELNRRFKRVFDLLVEKDVIVKNDRKRSKSAFAEKLGTKGHIIDLFLKEKRCITYEQAKKLCENFQVNEAYLFQGIGEPFEKINLPDPEKRLAAVLGISFSPNILFTSVEAFASNTVGVDLLEENEWFRIPGISGDLVPLILMAIVWHLPSGPAIWSSAHPLKPMMNSSKTKSMQWSPTSLFGLNGYSAAMIISETGPMYE